LNGIVSHEDWLPTFAAIAGDTDVKERLLKGTTINGRRYRNHIDGENLLDYLSGKTEQSPRNDFMYVGDEGQILAIRYGDWKVTFQEQKEEKTVRIWLEPFTELRAPMLTNLRRDPFEKAQHASNTYWDWYMSRIFVIVPLQGMAARFLQSMQDFPPSQTAGSFNLEKVQKQIEAATGAR
jgi:arylsulfatase